MKQMLNEWFKKKWHERVVRPRLKRDVQKAAYVMLMLNQAMLQARTPRKLRRQFFRELWRRPASAAEIIERALYGRKATLSK